MLTSSATDWRNRDHLVERFGSTSSRQHATGGDREESDGRERGPALRACGTACGCRRRQRKMGSRRADAMRNPLVLGFFLIQAYVVKNGAKWRGPGLFWLTRARSERRGTRCEVRQHGGGAPTPPLLVLASVVISLRLSAGERGGDSVVQSAVAWTDPLRARSGSARRTPAQSGHPAPHNARRGGYARTAISGRRSAKQLSRKSLPPRWSSRASCSAGQNIHGDVARRCAG